MLPSKYAKIVRDAVAKNTLLYKSGSAEAAAHVLSLQKEVRSALIMSKGFQASHLSKINAELKRVAATFDKRLASTVAANQDAAWKLGAKSTADGLKATLGLDFALLPDVLLVAAKDYAASLITDLSKELVEKISADIRVGVVLGENPYETMQRVENHLFKDGEGAFFRAETIVRTENNRIFQLANQERMSQAAADLPKLKKIWIAATDERTRDSHYQASLDYSPGGDPGPIPIDQPFIVGGEELMFPSDPEGEAGNVINCRCVSEPFMDDWQKDAVDAVDAAEQPVQEGGPGSGRYPAGSGKDPQVDATTRGGINTFAKNHADARVETAAVIGRDGKVLFSKTGDATSVHFSDEDLRTMFDHAGTFVHNHPDFDAPFSNEDIEMGVATNAEELVVISKNMEFSLTVDNYSKGWPMSREIQSAVESNWDSSIDKKFAELSAVPGNEAVANKYYDDKRREMFAKAAPRMNLKYKETIRNASR